MAGKASKIRSAAGPNRIESMRPVRQIDIARAAGVSRGAVSAVLSADKGKAKNRIHPDTAERIRTVASELGYQADVMANGLRGGRTRSIAAFWQFTRGTTGDDIVASRVMLGAQKQGYATYHAAHPFQPEETCRILDDLLRRRIDLLLLQASVLDLTSDEVLQRLEAFPALVGVVLDSTFVDRFPGDVVLHNQRPAIAGVLDHFASTGRRRPALLHTHHPNNQNKEHIFLECAQMLEFEAVRILDAPRRWGLVRSYQTALEESLFPVGSDVDIDALLVMSDEAAFTAMRFFEARGLRIPDDLAVVGMNDIEIAPLWRPALASIDRSHQALEEAINELVFARLDNPDRERQVRQVDMTFVHRESAG